MTSLIRSIRAVGAIAVASAAVGIVTRDGLAEQWFFGENAAGDDVDTQTLFEIGSATKAFFGVTEALQVQAGELDWNDRVRDHYPEFTLHDEWVTNEFRVVDLLAQRSGRPPYAADMFGHLGYPYDDAIEALRYVEPVSSFRNEFAYQNISHLVAGKIVAAQVGAPDWGTAVESMVFDALGMDATSVGYDALASSENTTVGHESFDGRVREVGAGRLPTDAQGAGGIVSNLDDMAAWMTMHLNRGEGFIDADVLEETHRPRVPITGPFAEGMKQGSDTPRLSYATGWLVHAMPEGRVIEHGGTTNGYTSSVRFDPDRGIGVVVLTNLAHNGGLATPIAQYAMDLIQGRDPVDYEARIREALAERDAAAPQPVDVAPAAPERLAGRYTHPVGGTIDVEVVDGQLWTVIGPRRIDARFEPHSDTDFTLRWQFDNDPKLWHLDAPAVFVGDGPNPEALQIADIVFTRD